MIEALKVRAVKHAPLLHVFPLKLTSRLKIEPFFIITPIVSPDEGAVVPQPPEPGDDERGGVAELQEN